MSVAELAIFFCRNVVPAAVILSPVVYLSSLNNISTQTVFSKVNNVMPRLQATNWIHENGLTEIGWRWMLWREQKSNANMEKCLQKVSKLYDSGVSKKA